MDGSCCRCDFNLRNWHAAPRWLRISCSRQRCTSSSSFVSSTGLGRITLSDFTHSNSCKVLAHRDFNLHFPGDKDVEYLYMWLFGMCIFIWWTCPDLCPFVEKLGCFLVEFREFFIHSGCKFFMRYMLCKGFLPVCGLSIHFLNRIFWRADILVLINLFICFIYAFGVISKKSFPSPRSQNIFPFI